MAVFHRENQGKKSLEEKGLVGKKSLFDFGEHGFLRVVFFSLSRFFCLFVRGFRLDVCKSGTKFACLYCSAVLFF